MDTFTAVPSFQRLPITILDQTKLEDWIQNGAQDDPIPTITQIFIGYEKGPGTPVTVQIEVDQIDTEYTQNLPTEEDAAKLTAFEYSDKWRRVNMLLRRNLLLAVIPKLDPEDANVLAVDGPDSSIGTGQKILIRLGWFQDPEARRQQQAEEIETENKEEGEVQEVGETGESTSLISQPSTQESTSRRRK